MTTASIDWHGPKRQPCPACGRGPKDMTLGVTLDERGGVAHCHRCGHVEPYRSHHHAQHPGRPVGRAAGSFRHETLAEVGCALWRACTPLGGDAVAYLRARCCVVPPADGDLRWHPALKHPASGMVGPALVALVTDAVTRDPLTLHRTWICADGSKAPLTPSRMLLRGHRKTGGVVRLWPDDAVTMGLGIAEGIETALSLAHAFTPVWACIDAGNLAALPVVAGIEALTIAADHDRAGIDAAQACAMRWSGAGCEVRVATPTRPHSDLNDEVIR